jgi:hypothetical protein
VSGSGTTLGAPAITAAKVEFSGVRKLHPGNATANTAPDHVDVLGAAIAELPGGHRSGQPVVRCCCQVLPCIYTQTDAVTREHDGLAGSGSKRWSDSPRFVIDLIASGGRKFPLQNAEQNVSAPSRYALR